MQATTTARLSSSPLRLLAQAAGTPREMAAKLARLGHALAAYVHPHELDTRLGRLEQLGAAAPPG